MASAGSRHKLSRYKLETPSACYLGDALVDRPLRVEEALAEYGLPCIL